jgi:hypothetical protein
MPHDGILAAAKELRTKNPEAFKSDGAAVEAYCRTAQGKAAYESYRESILAGDPRLPHAKVTK